MATVRPFRVELVGTFYTVELYDSRGRELFDLNDAAEAAEDAYGDGWESVYNGDVAITRDEWLEARELNA